MPSKMQFKSALQKNAKRPTLHFKLHCNLQFKMQFNRAFQIALQTCISICNSNCTSNLYVKFTSTLYFNVPVLYVLWNAYWGRAGIVSIFGFVDFHGFRRFCYPVNVVWLCSGSYSSSSRVQCEIGTLRVRWHVQSSSVWVQFELTSS